MITPFLKPGQTTWSAIFTDNDGKRCIRSLKTEDHAEALSLCVEIEALTKAKLPAYTKSLMKFSLKAYQIYYYREIKKVKSGKIHYIYESNSRRYIDPIDKIIPFRPPR